MIEIASLWRSQTQEFEVTAAWTQGGERWVQYQNLTTGQNHSCLEPAFLERFQEIVNDSRTRPKHRGTPTLKYASKA